MPASEKWIVDKLYRFISRIHSGSGEALKKLKEYRYFSQFEEREDDIYVTTFLKSGTTWMQMILYQLTTGGNIDFNHIYDISPWPTNAAIKGEKPPNGLPSPRILKSHDPYDNFNKDIKGRFIFVYRNAGDVAVSLFHHLKNYEDPGITMDAVLERYFREDKEYNYYTFHRQWFLNKHKFPVLYIRYEDLKNSFDLKIRQIAAFIRVDVTEELIERVRERSSFEFMKQHEEKFGEQPTDRDKRRYDQFIRKGATGEGAKTLTEEQKETIRKGFNGHLKEFEPLFDPAAFDKISS